MLVEPINAFNKDAQITSTKKLDMIDITPLLPSEPQKKNLWDYISPPKGLLTDLHSLLTNMFNMKIAIIKLQNPALSNDVDSGLDYERYLQFPNSSIKALASSIVSLTDSDDTKMYKIEQWVINNIEYVSDIEQYKQSELWAYPTMTVNSYQGDCEDGAFLIHSLALNAGVDPNRLRTYGGIVTTSEGSRTGGHAWTAYQRESDNEWIILDWCYWPTSEPLNERYSMSENLKYIDDYFFVQATKTIETPYTNRVRFAEKKPLFIDIII